MGSKERPGMGGIGLRIGIQCLGQHRLNQWMGSLGPTMSPTPTQEQFATLDRRQIPNYFNS